MILLKSIPKVDKFISNIEFKEYPKSLITQISKEVLQKLREDILDKKVDEIDEQKLIQEVIKEYNNIITPSLKKVINATGVIIHTNLGRSLIDENVFERVKEIATSYNNLEYDLEKGERRKIFSYL